MIFEGFLVMHHNGRYAIHNVKTAHELVLNGGDLIEVNVGPDWIVMQVKHDNDGYYLQSDKISFYPKMVYARYGNKLQ